MEFVFLNTTGVVDLSGELQEVDVTDGVLITNNADNQVFVFRGSTAPQEKEGFPLYQGDSTLVTGVTGETIYVSGARGNLIIQQASDAIVKSFITDFPQDVWTSNRRGTRRLQVDEGQTGFEEGRSFYCLASATIPAASAASYLFTFTTDFIFEASFLTVINGDVLLEVYQGGTDDGNFSVPVAIFNANTMSDVDSNGYTTGTTKFSGGVYNSDGILIDYIRAKTDANTNKSIGAESTFLKKIGLPAGNYYFKFSNLSGSASAEVMIKERWEERPSQY